MTTTDTANDVKGTTDTDSFNEILEDAKRPRSIRQIKEKWELSFPFRVRRVTGSEKGLILNVNAIGTQVCSCGRGWRVPVVLDKSYPGDPYACKFCGEYIGWCVDSARWEPYFV